MTLSLTLVQGAYIVAGLLFILALAGLSRHETARAGNRYGVIGMGIALVITVLAAVGGIDAAPLGKGGPDRAGSGALGLGLIVAAMAIGAAIGIWRAKRVEMTGMPELIALLHSFVGLAAVLVGWNSSYEVAAYPKIHDIEVFVGVFIGAVTLTGSIVAYLKLSAKIKSAPLVLPARHALFVEQLREKSFPLPHVLLAGESRALLDRFFAKVCAFADRVGDAVVARAPV